VTRFDKVIPAGSAGKIHASVDVSHLKGQVQKAIDIRSNDPVQPDAKVFIKATVKMLVDIQPAEHVRFLTSKGKEQAQELTLIPEKSVKLKTPVSGSDMLSVVLSPPDNQGRQKLAITMKNANVIGTHASEIKIPVEGPIPEIAIPVVMIIRGPLTVNPPSISFQIRSYPEEIRVEYTVDVKQAPDPDAIVVDKVLAGRTLKVLSEMDGWYQVITFEKEKAGASSAGPNSIPFRKIGWIKTSVAKTNKEWPLPDPQRISIQSADGRPFKVLGVVPGLAQVKVEKSNSSDENFKEFTVSLNQIDRSKKGSHRGEILVNTDNADQPQIKIPVFLNVL